MEERNEQEIKKLYRVEGSHIGENNINFLEYDILKETPMGYWINKWSGSYWREITKEDMKWVSKDGKKRFAYPTKEEAIQSFIFRKKRQIKILSYQLSKAKNHLHIAEKEIKNVESIDRNPILA